MAEVDIHDRLALLERTVAVLLSVVRAGSNKEGQAAIDATGFAKAMAPQSQPQPAVPADKAA